MDAVRPSRALITVQSPPGPGNVVALKATKNVDLLELVRLTLRMRPDRIIVGEVRGREAHPMIKAWNTGHEGGVCTIHANSAHAALTRLERLIAEATSADMRADIAEAVHYVVHITKTQTNVRKVLPIVRSAVVGLAGGSLVTAAFVNRTTVVCPTPSHTDMRPFFQAVPAPTTGHTRF
jgi:Flp pilus assembly CpaF family ATPase